MSPTSLVVLKALQDFANTVTRAFKSRTHGNPEEQLKSPTQTLLQQVGTAVGSSILCKPESAIPGTGRPDIAVEVDSLLNGYVELKAPNKTVESSKLKGHDKSQWQKFSTAIPNLLYTNGKEWILYRGGTPHLGVEFSGDVAKDGSKAVDQKDADEFEKLMREFLSWTPISPRSPKALAQLLAPLCHILRDDVRTALQNPKSRLPQLAAQWRDLLFPKGTDDEFADAYAQTLTYALLLARFEGATSLSTSDAANQLRGGHDLMAAALNLLDDLSVKDELSVGVELLRRSIIEVDPKILRGAGSDPWLYFYEDFLAVYDKKLRDSRGVYYTPAQVVQTQVNLVGKLLLNRLDKKEGYADEDVVVLDPAAGTGTYPLAVLEHAFDAMKSGGGAGIAQNRLGDVAKRVHAFELLVGPYSVAHLRMAQRVNQSQTKTQAQNVQVYLTDTLESPDAAPPGQLPGFADVLGKEQEHALNVKKDQRVLVCLGNPPYDREQDSGDGTEDSTVTTVAGKKRHKGGWVRYGDGKDDRPILKDFTEPAVASGNGKHLKNLYNDYVYFWRWALWKVFEQEKDSGIVSFITASSFLRGPGFVGMREMMRRTFDEVWIIDLEGGNLGARKTQNVFKIQTPVAITVGFRKGAPDRDTPAKVRYAKIEGTSQQKLNELANIEDFDDLTWEECFSGWQDVLMPDRVDDYFSMPLLTNIFPWQHSGVQMKRQWPIGETEELLKRRWDDLLLKSGRSVAFRETRDRKLDRQYPPLDGRSSNLPALSTLQAGDPAPPVVRYAYRSFDRQWIIGDSRLGDFMRPGLWQIHSDRQIYLTSMLTEVLGEGPAAIVASEVPDLHHFRGSFGGKNTVPLWRDAAATEPNITQGVLDKLSNEFGRIIGAEDLFAYVCALLGSRKYVEMFWDELSISSPRLPLTKNVALFDKGVELGKALVRLQTYGERFLPTDASKKVATGRAKNDRPISSDAADYPEKFPYDPDTETIYIGKVEPGKEFIENVSPEVWNYEVSGLKVVHSWLSYRKLERNGRKSSTLDDIRPDGWTWQMTYGLLELIWTLEAIVAMEPTLDKLLDDVINSDLFKEEELPLPSEEEKKPPKGSDDKLADQEELSLLAE